MTHQTRSIASKMTKLIIAVMVVQLAVIGYVFFQSYKGRSDVVDSQRDGCDRGKLDRSANARGWRTAEDARLATVAKTLHISAFDAKQLIRQKPRPNDLPDLVAAREYNKTASGLEQRSKIKCKHVFPKAGLFP